MEKSIIVDWTAYYFNLKHTIVQQSTPRGTVIFENSGSTNQYGMETMINGVFQSGRRHNQLWNILLSHSLHLFYFEDYSRLSDGEIKDFSGNELTGVPQNVISGEISWELGKSFYMHGMIQAIGEIPLNDANDVYSDSYQDVSFKAGYRFTLADDFTSELFIGIRNVLDQKYSLGNDINAIGGRYYQPGSPRNYYVGFKFKI